MDKVETRIGPCTLFRRRAAGDDESHRHPIGAASRVHRGGRLHEDHVPRLSSVIECCRLATQPAADVGQHWGIRWGRRPAHGHGAHEAGGESRRAKGDIKRSGRDTYG